MFEIAPNFDEHPAIQRVLGDKLIPADKRFDLLFEIVPDEAWDGVEENYDADAWFLNCETKKISAASTFI
jgi:hypothetical protein